MKTIPILICLLAISCSAVQPSAALQQDDNILLLPAEGMTFRRIDPTRYGTNIPPFFLLETEVSNEMYAQYLRDTEQKKNDSLTVRQAHELHSNGKWSTASPFWRVDNMSLIWDATTPPKGKERYPVALIMHEDAMNFCTWLTKRHSEIGIFRLPTKDEWMVAAYGNIRDYPWGGTFDIEIPWVSPSIDRQRTEPVAVDKPTRDITPEGIRHLWGNVREYVLHPNDLWDVFWMGASFLSYPQKNNYPFQPRQDYWGYVHSGASKMEDVGFRVLLELK